MIKTKWRRRVKIRVLAHGLAGDDESEEEGRRIRTYLMSVASMKFLIFFVFVVVVTPPLGMCVIVVIDIALCNE